MDEVASIRARHKSAKPKPSNPAWCNSHYDMDRLFAAYDALKMELKLQDEANDILTANLAEIRNVSLDWAILCNCTCAECDRLYNVIVRTAPVKEVKS